MKSLIRFITASILLFSVLFAGETGKITGKAIDGETGNPLPGVNIVLLGTSFGAATDENGEFVIMFVPPGLYKVRLSFIGYANLTIENVRLTRDLTTKLYTSEKGYTISLSPEVVKGESVTVFAKKPLIEINATNEVRVVRAEDIKNMAVRGSRNIAALQTGVVDDNIDLHVRGGRSEEVGYYVDGVYVNSNYRIAQPSAGNRTTSRSSYSGEIPNLGLEEVSFQAGGFGAEYGAANAGIINTASRTGGEKYQFSGEAITDGFLSADPTVESKRPYAFSYGYNLFSGAFGGPVPGLKFLRFFGSAEYTEMDDGIPFSGLVAQYNGPINPANGLPGNGEEFEDINGNTIWDWVDLNGNGELNLGEYEPYTDADNDGEYDAPDWLAIDTDDINYVRGPKPNNGMSRLSLTGNLLLDLEPLTGFSWKMKFGGSHYDNENSEYLVARSLFALYNDASTTDKIGSTGNLLNRFNIATDKVNTLYGRLSGNVPGMKKLFFRAQVSHYNDNYTRHDPVHKKGYGNYRYEDGTVSTSQVPYIQLGKRDDFHNPTWVYVDSSLIDSVNTGMSNYDYWRTDTNLTFVGIDYDTTWINPLFSDVGIRPIPMVELANYSMPGYLTAAYRKRETSRNTFDGSLTWQVGDHEIKMGGSYETSTLRYYQMGRATSLSRYFENNAPYSSSQDRYRWSESLNALVMGSDGNMQNDEFTDLNNNGVFEPDSGDVFIDLPADGIPDFRQEPNDTWGDSLENADFNGDGIIDYDDYFGDYIFQAYKSAYAENIGYDVTGEHKLDTGLDKARKPVIGAFYLQDKYEIEDLILNIGARYDYIDAANHIWNEETGGSQNIVINTVGQLAATVYATDIDENGVLDPVEYRHSMPTLEDSTGRSQRVAAPTRSMISPRIGLAFPVTDRTVFHAQYGKYFQLPDLNRLFLSYTRFISNLEQGNFTTSANPDLQPVKTTAYEIGFKQLITNNVSVDATVFYKQMSGMIQLRTIANRSGAYALFVNGDYGTVRGLSLSVNTRRIKYVQVSANYTLQYAGGTGSTANGLFRIAWQGGNDPTFISPLDYDQRHTGSLMVDFRTSANSFIPLLGANMTFQYGSGMRYTPARPRTTVFAGGISDRPIAGMNTGSMPATINVDLRFDKTFNVGGVNLGVFLVIMNALDKDNVSSVWTGTGLPDQDGWLPTSEGQNWLNNFAVGGSEGGTPLYNARTSEELNFGRPRQVRLGIRVDL